VSSSDWFSKQTLGSLPARAARRWGGREAFCFRGRRWTFAEVAAGVDRVARGLMALGVKPGDTVGLWMMNRPEWIETAFAVLKIGAVLVPINTRLRTEDVAYIVGQSDASTLILAERSGPIDYLAMVRELVPTNGGSFVLDSWNMPASRMKPGSTTDTPTPSPRRSSRSPWAKPRRPNFVAE